MNNRFEWLHQQLTNADSTHVVFLDIDREIGWQEFSQRVETWYHTWSILPQSKWALYCTQVDEFAAAWLGALYAGQALYLPSDTLKGTMQHLSQWVQGFVGDFPKDEDIETSYIACSKSVSADLPNSLSSDGLTYFLTSGSTGLPKPIAKRIHQLVAEVEVLDRQFGALLDNTSVYATVSHQHFFGFIFRFLWPLLTGRGVAVDTLYYPENLLPLPERDVTLISSPAFLSRLTQLTDWPSMKARITCVFSAGGVLLDESAAYIDSLWRSSVIEIYGSTETGAMAYKRNAHKHSASRFSPLLGVEICSNDGGFLCLQAPYFEEPNVWYESADKAVVEHSEAGVHFVLQGRADRIVKLEEKRISLTSMERLLQMSDWVDAVKVMPIVVHNRTILGAVIALNGEGERYLRHNGRIRLIQMMKQYLIPHFELLAIPRRWRFVSDIPKNTQDKIEFQSLQSILENPPVCKYPELTSLSQQSNLAVLMLHIPNELIYFKGHFPDQAILPGVVQLDWAIGFAQSVFALEPHVVGAIKQLKFSQIIHPNQDVCLRLDHNMDAFATRFKYESDAGIHASGIISWKTHV